MISSLILGAVLQFPARIAQDPYGKRRLAFGTDHAMIGNYKLELPDMVLGIYKRLAFFSENLLLLSATDRFFLIDLANKKLLVSGTSMIAFWRDRAVGYMDAERKKIIHKNRIIFACADEGERILSITSEGTHALIEIDKPGVFDYQIFDLRHQPPKSVLRWPLDESSDETLAYLERLDDKTFLYSPAEEIIYFGIRMLKIPDQGGPKITYTDLRVAGHWLPTFTPEKIIVYGQRSLNGRDRTQVFKR